MLGWFPGERPRAQPQAWVGSFHVASWLDQAPVVDPGRFRKLESGVRVADLKQGSGPEVGDGSRIASGGVDKTVRVWDVATKQCVATLEGHTSYVNEVCGLGDGARIASGCCSWPL